MKVNPLFPACSLDSYQKPSISLLYHCRTRQNSCIYCKPATVFAFTVERLSHVRALQRRAKLCLACQWLHLRGKRLARVGKATWLWGQASSQLQMQTSCWTAPRFSVHSRGLLSCIFKDPHVQDHLLHVLELIKLLDVIFISMKPLSWKKKIS